MKVAFLGLPESERRLYIEEAAARRGVSAVIIEKDLWVSWMLAVLFWSLADTIMRHLLIDRFRRKSVRSKVMRRLRDETTEDDLRERTADSNADSRDAAARLLEALTPEECVLVQLRLKGLGWRQVGDTLGISEDAATGLPPDS